MSNELVPINDMKEMASAVAKSHLFGFETAEQAMSIMLIAQAEGYHPALAARDYNVIKGKPALKADAMLARFQAAGGKVNWTSYTDERVVGEFSHPNGGTCTIDWDMVRARKCGLGSKDNWLKWPRQMLRARVISEGVRTVYPGVSVGIYTPEEVQDFDDRPRPIAHPEPDREIDGHPAPKHDITTTEYTEVDSNEAFLATLATPIGSTTPPLPVKPKLPTPHTGKLENVEVKEGTKKDGTKWTRYGITIDGVIYGSFSDTIGKLAQESSGKCVMFNFVEDGKFKTLTALELKQQN